MAPREAKVQELVTAAMDGMEPVAAHATADEVLSACFTIAHRAIYLALAAKADRRKIREALEQMMMFCADEGPVQ